MKATRIPLRSYYYSVVCCAYYRCTGGQHLANCGLLLGRNGNHGGVNEFLAYCEENDVRPTDTLMAILAKTGNPRRLTVVDVGETVFFVEREMNA